MKKHSRLQSGFTLIELAIVLVIIGLVAGAVLGGQYLIRASELRSVVSEREKFDVALSQFKDRYRAFPGDTKRASEFWTGETNGDGNGQIDYNERLRFWRHLALARLVDGEYSGTLSAGSAFDPGINVPASASGTAGWGVYVSWWLTAQDQKTFTLLTMSLTEGKALTPAPATPQVAVMPKGSLLPSEAWGIDQKADDGLPTTGLMVAYSADEPMADAFDGRGCIDTVGVQPNSKYLVNDEPVHGINACFVAFKTELYVSSRDSNPIWWPGYIVP